MMEIETTVRIQNDEDFFYEVTKEKGCGYIRVTCKDVNRSGAESVLILDEDTCLAIAQAIMKLKEGS